MSYEDDVSAIFQEFAPEDPGEVETWQQAISGALYDPLILSRFHGGAGKHLVDRAVKGESSATSHLDYMREFIKWFTANVYRKSGITDDTSTATSSLSASADHSITRKRTASHVPDSDPLEGLSPADPVKAKLWRQAIHAATADEALREAFHLATYMKWKTGIIEPDKLEATAFQFMRDFAKWYTANHWNEESPPILKPPAKKPSPLDDMGPTDPVERRSWLDLISLTIRDPITVERFREATGNYWTPGVTMAQRMADVAEGSGDKFVRSFATWIDKNVWPLQSI